MMSSTESTPVFICGHGSSGTTLFTALLRGHSELLVFPNETHYLQKVAQNPELSAESAVKWLLEVNSKKYMSSERVKELDEYVDYATFDLARIRKTLLTYIENGPSTQRNLFVSLMRAYGEELGEIGNRYWVEKTPGNEYQLSRALDWFPNLRAIYLVRDPRDVYISHARKRRIVNKSDSVENFVCRWGMSVWAWRDFTAINSNALTLRYEDLLHYPKETLMSVCSFLDIGWEDALAKPLNSQGELWKGNSLLGAEFKGISTKPIGRWKDKLTEEAVRLLEGYLGKTMVSLGYRLNSEPARAREVIGYWLKGKRKKQLLGTSFRLYWPFRLPKRLRD